MASLERKRRKKEDGSEEYGIAINFSELGIKEILTMNKHRMPQITCNDITALADAINLIADGSADRIERKSDELKMVIYYMDPVIRVDIKAIRGTE